MQKIYKLIFKQRKYKKYQLDFDWGWILIHAVLTFLVILNK